VQHYLPPKLQSQLDSSSVEIVKESFIDKALVQHYSDIVYKVNVAGKQTFVYLLFEHKSYRDNWVGFQLLKNMVKLWEQYRKKNRNAKKLPLIIPVVFYHGTTGWQPQHPLGDLIDSTAETYQYVPSFSLEFLDIRSIPDEKIVGAVEIQVLLLVEKYIKNEQFLEKLPDILDILESLTVPHTKLEMFETLMRYIFSTIGENKVAEMESLLKKKITKEEMGMRTIAEKYFDDGVEEKSYVVARKAILNGLSNEIIHSITDLPLEIIEKLRREIEGK
jgi:predicted transposase/invertase (TIGR01784 family)